MSTHFDETSTTVYTVSEQMSRLSQKRSVFIWSGGGVFSFCNLGPSKLEGRPAQAISPQNRLINLTVLPESLFTVLILGDKFV